MHRARALIGLVVAGLAITSCNNATQRPSLSSTTSAPPDATVTTVAAPTTTTTAVAPVKASPAGPSTTLGTLPAELNAPKLTDTTVVTTLGVGPVGFGIPLPAAEKAAGTRLLTENGSAPTGDCYVVKPEKGPAGLFIVMIKGTVQRFEIRSGAVKTRSAIGVGSTVTQLTTAYKTQLAQQGTAYVYTPSSAPDNEYRLIFETDGGPAVTRYRIGHVGYIETANACG